MNTLTSLSRDKQSLLLYLETRTVDYFGRVDTSRMNAIDFEIAAAWAGEGFIQFGRIRSSDHNDQGTHWVTLSEEARTLAHALRTERAARGWETRRFETTEEKKAGGRARKEVKP